MEFKTGTKLTCRDTGAVFIITESTEIVTRYRNGAIQGECHTPRLAELFEVGGV